MKTGLRLMFQIGALAMSIMILLFIPTASAEQMDSNLDILARSRIAFSTDGNVIMAVQKEINYFVTGKVPGEIKLPIVFANLSGENGITISELMVKIAGSDEQDKKDVEIKLVGLPNTDIPDNAGISLDKGRYTFTKLKERTKMTAESFKMPEDIEKGAPQTLLITAVINTADGSKCKVEAKTKLTFRSLPTRNGWYCGDGHMHTTWSDGLDRLDERAAYLKNAGMGWAVFTDHEKLLRGHFEAYRQAIASSTRTIGFPLASGMEISAAGERGHALAYGLNEQVSTTLLPADYQYDCQALVDHINDLSPGHRFTVIAHPYSSAVWQDIKTNSNFQAMELASSGKINEQAFLEWMRKLRGGEKITALGSSDYHLGYPEGMTYLYIPDYSSLDFDPVWQAIKMGRASVSEKGHLGVFAINGQAIGSTLKVSSGAPLIFTLIQQPCSGVVCSSIEVLDENGQVVYQAANPAEKTTFEKPANSRFYLLRACFSDGSKVVSNPIYVEQG